MIESKILELCPKRSNKMKTVQLYKLGVEDHEEWHYDNIEWVIRQQLASFSAPKINPS